MNPSLQQNDIIFDSNFESGNLDCVVKINEFEFENPDYVTTDQSDVENDLDDFIKTTQK